MSLAQILRHPMTGPRYGPGGAGSTTIAAGVLACRAVAVREAVATTVVTGSAGEVSHALAHPRGVQAGKHLTELGGGRPGLAAGRGRVLPAQR
ncbi:hypothetical protein SAMN05216410_1338 [Sanguibacter gelidistatuariae]|uniref:Uncharacterized protein n=1 Tax=Sanguibacter gelidistatuariae TaxID=1814289 RepID=A0A1G6JJK1_9MICO|nr:hypothetical protein SAMN05216410_1338 [Sanguibacter gelidistatuariae]